MAVARSNEARGTGWRFRACGFWSGEGSTSPDGVDVDGFF